MIELVTSKIGEGSIRVALFHSSPSRGDICAASTYSLDTLRSEDAQYEAASYLVRQVRPQAGPHVVHRVADMIASNIKEYQ